MDSEYEIQRIWEAIERLSKRIEELAIKLEEHKKRG